MHPPGRSLRRLSGTQRIGLHLTDRCQLDCVHCLRDPAADAVDIDVALVHVLLAEARDAYGLRHVSLSGGEPTLHPRFDEIVGLIAGRGMAWDMVTNGRRLEAVLDRLAAVEGALSSCTQIVLSLDGATEATHDAIRGEGSHRDVHAAIASCVARGIPFATTTTLHAANASEVEAIGLHAAQLGARHVSFAMMQPTGTLHDRTLALPAARWRELHARIAALAGVLRVPVIASEGWPSSERMHLCSALRGETLHIDQHGRLTLCCLHADVPGEAREVAGSVERGLATAHPRLLEVVREAAIGRLGDLARRDPWAEFECNACLRRFGKPHWDEAGAVGPPASRERWRGAWSVTVQEARERRLRVLP